MVDTSKLAEVAARLNKESDSLNAIIQKIQDKVNGYNLGLEVRDGFSFLSQDVATGEGASRGTTLEKILGYTKFPEGWGFSCQEREVYYERISGNDWDRVGDSTLDNPVPLLKASREIRIAALTRLPRLIDQLQKKAEESLKEIEKARLLADEL